MRNRIGMLLLAGVLLFLFAGCRTITLSLVPGGSRSGPEQEPSSSGNNPLPQEMPEDFAVRFSCWVNEQSKNVLDTYQGYIQKDLIVGVARRNYTPARESMRSFYEKLLDLDIASISRTMTAEVLAGKHDTVRGMTPCTNYQITFTADNRTYTIDGDHTAVSYTNTDPEAAHFMELVRYMIQVLESAPEYQALPQPVGGYD